MPSFTCSACGYGYTSTHNFTTCPRCGGFGPLDPRCTCPKSSMNFETIRFRSGDDPNCPVHKEEIAAKKEKKRKEEEEKKQKRKKRKKVRR